MPALTNARHERFAQELAKGKTQEQAFIDAGGKADNARSQSSRLMSTNVNIQVRVADLQERGAVKVELTIADIIAELEVARIAALGAETVQASAAVNASKAKAELLGLGASRKHELSGPNGGAIQAVTEIRRTIVRPDG
jgi:phage terminase small subunit